MVVVAVVSPCIEHNAFPLEVKALMAVPALATATGLVTADTTAATAVAKAKLPIPAHARRLHDISRHRGVWSIRHCDANTTILNSILNQKHNYECDGDDDGDNDGDNDNNS